MKWSNHVPSLCSKWNRVLLYLSRSVPFSVSRSLKFNFLKLRSSLGCFLACWYSFASIENLRSLPVFQRSALERVFGNQLYKPHFCSSSSFSICYTFIIGQLICVSEILGFINLDSSKYIYIQSCLTPFRCERYPHCKIMNNFEPSQKVFFQCRLPNCQRAIRNETGFT